MKGLFLTPASLSYLNQVILTLVITLYLSQRFYKKEPETRQPLELILTVLFAAITAFSTSLFFEASLLPGERLPVVYVGNTLLAFLVLALIHFAYYFPAPRPRQKFERLTWMTLGLGYTLSEAGIAAWRFSRLAQGQVEFRPDWLDLAPALGFLWVILVFMRGAFEPLSQPAQRQFALIFLIPFALTLSNLLRSFNLLSTTLFQINLSVGMLITTFLFAVTYLSSQPETTSFASKFSAAVLTSVLAVLGMTAWLLAPAYVELYRPNLPSPRSLSFTPNARGGYDITTVPVQMETNLGENLQLVDSSGKNPSFRRLEFSFPFYGKTYPHVYVSDDGLLTFGENLDFKDLEANFSQVPAILALALDLDPAANPAGGVFARQEAQKLVVTYSKVRSFYFPTHEYTFQIILEVGGSFILTHLDLPAGQQYYLNDRPAAAPWAMGLKPGSTAWESVDFGKSPLSSGPEGALQDENLRFRTQLHHYLLPLAVAVIGSSLLFVLALPLNLHLVLTRPLQSLLKGVATLNQGQGELFLPIQANDEIGFLTESFNRMSEQINHLVRHLETRVQERTSDLLAANESLRKLSIAVEQSPSSILITDLQAQIEYVNPAFTQATGYTFAEVCGKNPRLLKSGLTPPGIYQAMWQALLAGQIWRGELCNRKKDGEIFWEQTVIAPILNEAGVATHYVSIKEDITAHKIAEEALKESEKRYRDLFEMESDAIFIIRNGDGAILEANSAAASLYGYSHSELLTLHNEDLSAEPEATRSATQSPIPMEQVLSIPLRWHRKQNGSLFAVEITARFITWQGELVHLAAIRDITKRRQVEQELERLAMTDPLTGLFNRRHFFTQAELFLQQAVRQGEELTVMMADLDHFKSVNDTYGHSLGDSALCAAAHRLHDNLRTTDLLGRYGGEEFIILLPKTGFALACHLADRLLGAIHDTPVTVQGKKISLSLSLGLAQLNPATSSLDQLIGLADQALYLAKQGGRNRWAAAPTPANSTGPETDEA